MEISMIIVLGIWAVIATFMCVISHWDKKTIQNNFELYKDSINKIKDIEKSGRKVIPVIYHNKTYFIYQDSNMLEAIKMIGLKPNTTYYDRTPNSKFNLSYIEYCDGGSIGNERLILNFENNVLRSVKNS